MHGQHGEFDQNNMQSIYGYVLIVCTVAKMQNSCGKYKTSLDIMAYWIKCVVKIIVV